MTGMFGAEHVVLATEPVDLRRGHDGLVTLVRTLWDGDPYCGTLFVFFGRRHDRIKVLIFRTGGFVIVYKRLERARFALPKTGPGENQIHLDTCQLASLQYCEVAIDLGSVFRLRAWSPNKAA